MFSIGDFARFAGVSVRTVRYYDEVGLLMPAEVDPATGYRSYNAAQIARLHRILALKELGLSLRQLRPLVDDLDAAALRGMLKLKRAELEDRVAEERERLARVERCLRAIEKENAMPADVVLKSLPDLRVAAVRTREATSGFNDVADLVTPAMITLLGLIEAAKIKPTGPPLIFYETTADQSLEPVAAVPIGAAPLPPSDGVIEVVLPAVEVATTLHRGAPDHSEIGPLYAQLSVWAEDHGYTSIGPGRDVILEMAGPDGNMVFELQLPCARERHSS